MENLNRKEMKKNAHHYMKKNFFMSIIIVFLISLILNNNYIFSSKKISQDKNALDIYELIKDDENKIDISKINDNNKYENNEKLKGILAPIAGRLSISKSPIYNFTYSIKLFIYKHDISKGLFSLFIAILSFLLYFFIKLVLNVGKNRFFLESRIYPKTSVMRLLFPYKVKGTLRLSWILFLKEFYEFLWSLTIIGGFIKIYEYRMIPYLLAENPMLSRKEVFQLSKDMMKGYKWQAFKLDMSLFGWILLGLGTLGISNLIYYDAYKEYVYAELYYFIRKNKKDQIKNSSLLNDDYLFEKYKEYDIYPEKKVKIPLKKISINTDYDQSYSVRNLILLFFTASFIGYSWEVLLHLVIDGTFVNRGTMFGPWLPIYGFGVILILSLLKPFRKKPLLFFISAMILAGILEYSTSFLLEILLHKKWWDYTGYFCNLHGRICLEGLLLFGFGGAAITYFLAPLLNSLFNKIKYKIIFIICFILVSLFGIDVVYSVQHPNTGIGITDY